MRAWMMTVALLVGCRSGFDADVLAGLVAHYAMDDDPSSGTITDELGGHPGSCQPATCPSVVTGRIGGAYHFDGSDLVRIGNSPAFMLPMAYTVSLWIRLADPATKQVAFSKPYGTTFTNSWLLLVQSTACYNSTSGTIIGSMCDSNPFPASEWVHLAALYEATSSSVVKALYVNGEKRQFNPNAMMVVFDDNDVLIGGDSNSFNIEYQLDGDLDDVRVYDRALDDAEITEVAGK